MRARRLPPLLVPLAAIVLLSAAFLAVRNSDETWNSVQQIAQQRLSDAEERLNEVGGKVLDTASSLADHPAPVESPTPTQVIVLAEPSVEDQAVRVALAAQETPAAELVIAPTTVSTSTTALTTTAGVTSTTPITAQAIALADVQTGAALELEESPTATQELAPTQAPTDTPVPSPTDTPVPSPTPTIAQATATRSGSAAATNKQAAPTATPVPPTVTPTATRIPPTATATPLPPTDTPTATLVPPTATATPLPPTATPRATSATSSAQESTYIVVSGDNWYNIARRFGITQEALAAANGTTPSDILQVDQILQIPLADSEPTRPSQATAKGTAVATQAATAVVQTYTVQRGDNWFSIAKRFGTTQEALAAYNGRSPNDILQVNQKLRIPPAGVVVAKLTPTSEPTKVAKPSPTSTSEPTLAPEPPAVVKLPAPVPLAPGNDDGFSADTLPVLTWQPVSGVNAGDYYYIAVRFMLKNGEMGFAVGETTDTSFTVPRWVFDQAQTPDRIGRWSVQVRRLGPTGDVIEVSPPSESRTFYWR